MVGRDFSSDLLQRMNQLVESLSPESRLAVFDADGTLWNADLGEHFFQWQIKNCNLPGLPDDPWQHYVDLKKLRPREALTWLAEVNRGQLLGQVREWAEACFREAQPWPFFEPVKRLVAYLQEKGFRLTVVTASVKWAVEPGAQRLGISPEHVVGVETHVRAGIVSGSPVFPVPWHSGKAQAYLEHTEAKPAIALGNTTSDLPLLALAQLPIVVGSQSRLSPKDHELRLAEAKLQEEGSSRGWDVHLFTE